MVWLTAFLLDQWQYIAVGAAVLLGAWYLIRIVALLLAVVLPGPFLPTYRRCRDRMNGWWHRHVVEYF